MLEALARLIQTEFNERFWQVFTSALPVRWPRLKTLIRTLTTGHFLPESVVMLGGFRDQLRGQTERQGNKLPMVPLEIGGGGEELTGREAQEKVANPDPLPDLQVRPGFKLHLAMDMAKDMTG